MAREDADGLVNALMRKQIAEQKQGDGMSVDFDPDHLGRWPFIKRDAPRHDPS